MSKITKILITGANGFIAQNLKVKLQREKYIELYYLNRNDNLNDADNYIKDIDIIYHLAGENRSKNIENFYLNNDLFTNKLCDLVEASYYKYGKKITIVYTSTIKKNEDSHYGKSKSNAEKYLKSLSNKINSNVFIYDLPNVFGKWSRPNHNSAIATWCHNISRGKNIEISDPNANLDLVYIDDLIVSFVKLIEGYSKPQGIKYIKVTPVYTLKLQEIVNLIYAFQNSRKSKYVYKVGEGFKRKLYSTFLSFMPKDNFKEEMDKYTDARGSFCEIIKTLDSGQFSFFTALPGVKRGSHYHDTKSEKFLVVKGSAKFKLKSIISGEEYSTNLSENKLEIIDSIPGWMHEITNIGSEILIVFVWANEVFDENQPDTFQYKELK